MGSPALAVTVRAVSDIGSFIISDVSLADDPFESLDLETSVEVGGGESIAVAATVSAPGFERASAAGGGTVTNLLDESVTVVLDYFFLVEAVVLLEGPSESGRARAAFDLFVDGAREDLGRAEVEFASSECFDFFPCDLQDIDPGAFAVGFELAPNETVPFTYTASALAVAPVPLPSTAGLALLALGGLTLVGRRRRNCRTAPPQRRARGGREGPGGVSPPGRAPRGLDTARPRGVRSV